MPTILCFGDSNTWGAVPNEDRRYGPNERWPSLLRMSLPDGYEVIEEGQPGRTTVHDDPFEGEKNGLRYLRPCLESHLPDLVIIMLGTNDMKNCLGLSAFDISRGAARLAQEVLNFDNWAKREAPQVLLVAPPPVHEIGFFGSMFIGGAEKSKEFGFHYRNRAEELGCAFLDAGTVVESCPNEGIHWQQDQHEKLAKALQPMVLAAFQRS
ncbi:Lipolytic enzyme, G-D-S-L [Vibrio owensii]|uniref:SGNH/GDSL hydrolase family protein n=1 Tax=Vibrio owensii TaxID=696485 RepID=UPI00289594EA|nr:Lipolytic enzyme, G-D-S-L [Vibrio owensii]